MHAARPPVIALLAVAALALVFVVAAMTSTALFERWMVEDGWVEWATAYAFVFAAAAAVATGVRELRDGGPGPCWLAIAVTAAPAAFALFVAGEELSWGQRLFAIEPPALFLEQNFQQELNLHNVLKGKELAGFSLDSRFLVALTAFVYGVGWPLVARALRGRASARALCEHAPSAWLTPAFAAVGIVELAYPVDLAGEAAECTLGALFAAHWMLRSRWWTTLLPAASAVPVALLTIVLAGITTPPVLAATLYKRDAEREAQARAELELLAADISTFAAVPERFMAKSRVHKRIYTAVSKGYLHPAGGDYLEGAASRADRERDRDGRTVRTDRRGYFLDPWNNPYWIYFHRDPLVLAVYSFGPNRQRDTALDGDGAVTEFAGDDVGVWADLESTEEPSEDVTRSESRDLRRQPAP